MVDSVMAAGMRGIMTGMQGLERNASAIAQSGTTQPDADVARLLVENGAHVQQIEAAAAAVEISNETIGTIIDRLA